MTKRLKKLTVAIAIGVVLIAAGIISGVCIINSSVNKRPTYVATAEELVAAINDDIDKPIVLSNDIVVHGDLAANKLFDLEMNDHNLRVIGTFTLKTDAAGEMYVGDGKNQIKKRERVQADKIVIDAVNATITWNANVQLKNGYTADDFVVSSADHTFIFNGLIISESGDAVKTAMTVKQGRVVVSASDVNVKTPAEIVVPADAKDAFVDNKTEAEVNIKASTSVSVAGTVSVDIDVKAENVKITAPEAGSSVTVKSGTAASVDAAGSDVIVDKGATVAGKVTAGKVENNGTVGEIDSDDVTDNSVAIRKADAKTELSAYALAKGKDNYSADGWEAIKVCVTAGNTAIDAATDIDGVNAAFAAAKAEIDKVKTAEQEAADALANKKTETLAALDEAKNNYKETDYREAEWTRITDAYNTAKNGINAVTVITALPGNFVATFTATASAQKTDFELYQSENKTAINEYADNKGENNYSAAKWTAIREYADAACDAIDAATDKNTVDTAVADAKRSIDGVTLAVVKLDGKGYDSLADAIAALTTTEEHTIKLLADVTDTTATEYVFDGVNVTLDLNGHVLDGLAYGGSAKTHYVYAVNGAVLTVTDGSEAKTGKLTSWYAGNSTLNVIYVENAKVVLNGGTITAHDANYGMAGIMAKANANVEINGGEVQGLYFAANRKRGYAINVAAATATLTVNGGVLSTDDPSCYAIYNTASGSTVSVNGGTIATISIAKNTIVSITGGTFKSAVKTDYLTKGYACLENEDGTYRVESGYVVTVGSVKYDTLSAAITAAKAGDVITVYNDVTENEGNIKYIIQKALTISGAYGATGVKPVIKGTFAVDINGISDGSDVVTIENLEIVHNGVYVKDGWTQDTKGAVVLQDGGITLKNNYIHLVNPAPANVSNSPSGLQLSRRGASVSTGAITVSGNTFGAYPKYSDKTNTIATAIQVTRNYTLSGVLVYGGLEVDDEKIYTGNKYENTDGNAQYVLYGNFDFAADKRGYTYVVFGDVFAYNRDGGDLLAGGKMIIARSFTLTDKIYEIKAGTELVIGKGATLDCNGLTLKVNGTLTVNGEITNVVYNYGENGKKVVYLSTVNANTVFDPNAEYVFATASTNLEPIAIAASAKVKKMTLNLSAAAFKIKINAPITVVSPVVINGVGVIKKSDAKTKFEITSDNAFIVKSGSLELNKIQLTHKSTTADTVKDFIKIDENANVAVTLNDVAFINTSNNSLFINVVSGATLDLSFSNVTVNGTAVAAESEIVKR